MEYEFSFSPIWKLYALASSIRNFFLSYTYILSHKATCSITKILARILIFFFLFLVFQLGLLQFWSMNLMISLFKGHGCFFNEFSSLLHKLWKAPSQTLFESFIFFIKDVSKKHLFFFLFTKNLNGNTSTGPFFEFHTFSFFHQFFHPRCLQIFDEFSLSRKLYWFLRHR